MLRPGIFHKQIPKKPPNTKVAVSLSMCNAYCFGGHKEGHTVDITIFLLYNSFLLKIRSCLTSLQFSHPPSPAFRLNRLKMKLSLYEDLTRTPIYLIVQQNSLSLIFSFFKFSLKKCELMLALVDHRPLVTIIHILKTIEELIP